LRRSSPTDDHAERKHHDRSGGSRGIGLAIGLRVAADDANVALLAKTPEPHPSSRGPSTAADEIERAGGKALPIVGDVRDEGSVARAVEAFGGITT
jgi:citronellol/citronellal dehydrogenase